MAILFSSHTFFYFLRVWKQNKLVIYFLRVWKQYKLVIDFLFFNFCDQSKNMNEQTFLTKQNQLSAEDQMMKKKIVLHDWVNYSPDISYTFTGNSIVLNRYLQEPNCFNRNIRHKISNSDLPLGSSIFLA